MAQPFNKSIFYVKDEIMAHSYSVILAFIPPVLIFSILTGYDRWIFGIKLPNKRRELTSYSGSEILYAFFAALTIIANFIGGLYLLGRFEPVSTIVCYSFLLILSLPLTGAALGHYAQVRYQKGGGFQAVLYTLFLISSLITLFGFAYNGFADEKPSQNIDVMVIDKRIQINKGGGTPLVKVRGVGNARAILSSPREIEISDSLYKEIQVGSAMYLSIKPGALGVPWLEALKKAGLSP